MSRPNRSQWFVIWATFLTASHIWLHLDLSDFLLDSRGAWGLSAYLDPALVNRAGRGHLAFVILGMGALLFWQLSGPGRARQTELGISSPERRLRGFRWRNASLALIVVLSVVLWGMVVAILVRQGCQSPPEHGPRTVLLDPAEVQVVQPGK